MKAFAKLRAWAVEPTLVRRSRLRARSAENFGCRPLISSISCAGVAQRGRIATSGM